MAAEPVNEPERLRRALLGAHVLVYWNDGLWHAGTIRQFRDGNYEVALDGLAGAAWVPADHVRPA